MVISLPVTHLIRTVLRPGVQSIQIQYKYQSSTVWTNYNEGQRIPGGVDVKFIVTPYPNFTLTEWKAYYSDEYDDTVNIPLTGIQGESAWTFVLPSADVWIRCEAEYSGSTTQLSNIGGFTRCEPDREVTVLTFLTAAQFLNSINSTLIDMGYSAVNSNMENIIINNYPQNSLANLYINSSSNILEIWYFIFDDYSMTFEEMTYSHVNKLFWKSTTSVHGFDWNSTTDFTQQVEPGGRSIQIAGYYFENRTAIDFGCAFPSVATYALTSPIVDEKYSIRYIINPADSGEIDIAAPTEIEVGITQFTFKWRVKYGYSFKRLTPFAIGEGSLEESINYTLDSYDGENRTYTFTITNIPSWAIGVRVLIEGVNNNDPNSPINPSGPNGGNGTFDDTSDDIPLPAIPNISVADSGFVTLFRPSITQVKALGNYLWSNLGEFWENLQKLFTNPMDYFIAFNILPVTPSVGNDKTIYIGNWATNISMPPVLRQFYEFNCGTIQIQEYFGSYLDYAPNTRARIMLPFIGDRDLAINEIMGKTLHLWYRIDLLTGACAAILTVNDSVYYQWNGNCAIGVPVTGSDWSRLYSAVARTALVGAGYMALGAGGAITSSIATTATSGVMQGATIADLGRVFNASPKGVSGVSRERNSILNAMDNIAEPGTRTITSHSSRAINGSFVGGMIGNNIMSGISRVQHSGDISGAISIMGNRTPYIVLEYPNLSMPENYKHLVGYPSNIYTTLSQVEGYTKCKVVMFESNKATDDEIEMVIAALKGGVYL